MPAIDSGAAFATAIGTAVCDRSSRYRSMVFQVAADAYDEFMGRYSRPLSAQLADLAGVRRGLRVLDVGCGTGALTAELVERTGAGAVSAVDPSTPFVEAVRARLPGVDVRQASVEALPFDDHAFDASLAQLVVHFMTDPVAGIAEMARVTRSGGVVAASVWDHAGGKGPLAIFWHAARSLDPAAPDESDLPGVREGHLAEILRDAGLRDVESTALVARRMHPTFADWWEPFTRGVGPAGAYLATLDERGRERVREACRDLVPAVPFEVTAVAWAARGLV